MSMVFTPAYRTALPPTIVDPKTAADFISIIDEAKIALNAPTMMSRPLAGLIRDTLNTSAKELIVRRNEQKEDRESKSPGSGSIPERTIEEISKAVDNLLGDDDDDKLVYDVIWNPVSLDALGTSKLLEKFPYLWNYVNRNY